MLLLYIRSSRKASMTTDIQTETERKWGSKTCRHVGVRCFRQREHCKSPRAGEYSGVLEEPQGGQRGYGRSKGSRGKNKEVIVGCS